MTLPLPTQFASEIVKISTDDIEKSHQLALNDLEQKGYYISLGVREADVPEMTAIGKQRGTREYCPGDLTHRWGDVDMARSYLKKDGGRAMVLLRKQSDDSIMGFGWTRKISMSDKIHLPMCENTFGIRLHEESRGQKLASPFTEAIVAASMQLFDVRAVGLESWQSNVAAIKSYIRAGAKVVTVVPDLQRPTLDESKPTDERGEHYTIDSRVYMQFDWSA